MLERYLWPEKLTGSHQKLFPFVNMAISHVGVAIHLNYTVATVFNCDVLTKINLGTFPLLNFILVCVPQASKIMSPSRHKTAGWMTDIGIHRTVCPCDLLSAYF